jgi:hypothetical protein
MMNQSDLFTSKAASRLGRSGTLDVLRLLAKLSRIGMTTIGVHLSGLRSKFNSYRHRGNPLSGTAQSCFPGQVATGNTLGIPNTPWERRSATGMSGGSSTSFQPSKSERTATSCTTPQDTDSSQPATEEK